MPKLNSGPANERFKYGCYITTKAKLANRTCGSVQSFFYLELGILPAHFRGSSIFGKMPTLKRNCPSKKNAHLAISTTPGPFSR